MHDFWGQDIKLFDSHKSFRPLTVLTFRMNYLLHGFHPHGYHVLNVFVYGLVVVSFFYFSLLWMNKQGNECNHL